ncbi:hypothetical protein ACFL59_04725, partial [Planctomycetota bacterium]
MSHIRVFAIGAVAGAASQLNWLAGSWDGTGKGGFLARVLIGAVVGGLLCAVVQRLLRTWVSRLLSGHQEAVRLYQRYDWLTFLSTLLLLLGALGYRTGVPVALGVVTLFGMTQGLLLLAARHRQAPDDPRELALTAVPGLFFVSGFAALIYQIAWQRVLFAAFGVNIESVTVIVSIFMLGLGVGALFGGLLSRRFPKHTLLLFLISELGIGAFGVFSLSLIGLVSNVTAAASLPVVAGIVAGLLFIPTVFMGATLPILVSYLVRHSNRVGGSVGLLYFLNTVGSALASVATVEVLFVLFDVSSTVRVAAACNCVVGILAYLLGRRIPGADSAEAQPPAAELSPKGQAEQGTSGVPHWRFAVALSALIGFVSLSQEILWFRAVSYATGGSPSVFGHVLACFLGGIALGALLAKRVCDRGSARPLPFVAVTVLLASVVYFFAMPVCGYLFTMSESFSTTETPGLLGSKIAITVVATLLGGIFPILCEYGVRADRSAGLRTAYLYLANIVGSVAGPLLTGFVLLQYLSLERLFLGFSLLSLVVPLGLSFHPDCAHLKRRLLYFSLAAVAIMALAYVPAYESLLEKLHFKDQQPQVPPYARVLHSRSGIIAVTATRDGADYAWGGGVYDGRFNTDVTSDVNWINRAYVIPLLHPDPQEILSVGLGTGSWSAVAVDHDAVRSMDIVEISLGYLDLIRSYPEFAQQFSNPKVTIHI